MMCTSKPPKADRSLPPTRQPNLLTKLMFDELTSFEAVCNQYQHLGVHVEGAIAIQPSNSAFQPAAAAIVLLPASNGPIVITFDRPVEQAVAIVNGARQIRITGFDRHSNVLAHERTATRLLQIPAESIATFPWHKLALNSAGMTRMVIASDAPFLLQSLSYY